MTSIRAAKAKGSSFEYDCQHSLQAWAKHPVIRTAERGFQMQYDLRIDTDSGYIAFECKRLKGISWNQAKKYLDKLYNVASDAEMVFLLFQSNRQPCLVMFMHYGIYAIQEFEAFFYVTFEKHPSTRVTKK